MKDNRYFAPYIRSFFEDHLVRRRNLSRNSIWSYRDAIKLLLQFTATRRGMVPSTLLVTDVDEQLVLDFLRYLEQERGNSIQTCNQRLITLRAIFEYIAFRDPLLVEHCKRITTIPLKRGAIRPQIEYLTKDEMKAILAATEDATWAGRRDYALLLYMYNTGSRAQETVDARTSWLSLHGPYKVEILGKANKSRICPLWNTTAKVLEKHLTEQHRSGCRSDHLFFNRHRTPLTRSGVTYIIDSCVRQAACKMPSLKNRRITPHTLRHTTAMHLLQSGVEINVIKSWLGHVSVVTTNKYVEIDLEMKRRALQACEITAANLPGKRQKVPPELLTWLESL